MKKLPHPTPHYHDKTPAPSAHHKKDFSMGLTQREEFAKAAMQGILSHAVDWRMYTYEFVAVEAVRFADALIRELSKSDPAKNP